MKYIEDCSEWIKWLSYIPEFEKTRIENLKSKKSEDLTKVELQELNRYKKQAKILTLLKKYGTADINEEEYMDIYKYIKDNSIEDLMISKLSKEELEYSKKQIEYYSNISDNELNKKINTEQQEENYKKLSMTDSYILHIISKTNFNRGLEDLDLEEIRKKFKDEDLNNEISKKIKEDAVKQYRSMQHASKFVCV